MVSFSCESCGDVVKKPKLEKHKSRCTSAVFTCIDCNITFQGGDYRAHTSCISEAQKYQGALYRPAKGKEKMAQNGMAGANGAVAVNGAAGGKAKKGGEKQELKDVGTAEAQAEKAEEVKGAVTEKKEKKGKGKKDKEEKKEKKNKKNKNADEITKNPDEQASLADPDPADSEPKHEKAKANPAKDKPKKEKKKNTKQTNNNNPVTKQTYQDPKPSEPEPEKQEQKTQNKTSKAPENVQDLKPAEPAQEVKEEPLKEQQSQQNPKKDGPTATTAPEKSNGTTFNSIKRKSSAAPLEPSKKRKPSPATATAAVSTGDAFLALIKKGHPLTLSKALKLLEKDCGPVDTGELFKALKLKRSKGGVEVTVG